MGLAPGVAGAAGCIVGADAFTSVVAVSWGIATICLVAVASLVTPAFTFFTSCWAEAVVAAAANTMINSDFLMAWFFKWFAMVLSIAVPKLGETLCDTFAGP